MNSARLMLIAQWEGKLPDVESLMLSKQLEEVDEETLGMLMALQLKNPIIGLVLGLLLGFLGADRFYKGDIGLGIAKLLCCTLLIFLLVTIVIGAILCLIDLFLVWNGIKKDNAAKIAQALAFAKSEAQK